MERAARSVPGLRHIPVARLLIAADLVLIARNHIAKLEPHERRRVFLLLRKGRGRPSHLSRREREELHELIAKAEPRLFAAIVAEELSPIGLPQRLTRGRKKR